MNQLNNILALVTHDIGNQHAVQKAISLAEKANAQLTLLIVSPHQRTFFLSVKDKEKLIIQQKIKDEVSRLINEVKARGLNIELQVMEGNRDYKSVLNLLAQRHFDLVIKNHEFHQHRLFGVSIADDYHLLRDIDTPVMLVNGGSWSSNGHIVTAIDVDDTNEQHSHFNHDILHSSGIFSNILGTDVHLLNCYLGEEHSMEIKFRGEHQKPLTQKEIHQLKLAEYSKDLMLASDHVHLELGFPDDVIPKVAEKYQADIIILGAGEHHGLSHLFSGHTSEYVIDRVHCDVLALKPTQLMH